ncbi:helix-turn-helix domain-containing protein [Microbulbifer hydrolyticus]|uniref:Helix-turn-helix domain-containing protein n=1 Tax=Microbulbifer hydrolyticus TaxID=48074 RepID=A0A6P1TBP7_9GAMM|nr:helix-turn-helix domain-containing protein [Microbulbifer hydrolyticus]MBB5210040.1 transcriptional regulator GlxA family with amidase domain [Microbulbifer hydrolyticus]QHQ39437.1 helix-turn-helix domain-containing protein [Microbulbifer hydrolyticus]
MQQPGPVRDQRLFEEAMTLMRNNLSEPLQTGELASYLSISQKKLERLFLRFEGVLPARFYRELRLEKARSLLHESALGIDEIGRRCGFRSASHFSRCFKSFCGHSPRMERQQGGQLRVESKRSPFPGGRHCGRIEKLMMEIML